MWDVPLQGPCDIQRNPSIQNSRQSTQLQFLFNPGAVVWRDLCNHKHQHSTNNLERRDCANVSGRNRWTADDPCLQIVNVGPMPSASIIGVTLAVAAAPKTYCNMYLLQMTSDLLDGKTSVVQVSFD